MKQPILGAVAGMLFGLFVAGLSGAGNPWSDLRVERHTQRFVAVVVMVTIGGGLLGRFGNRSIPRGISIPLIVFFGLCLIPFPHPKTGSLAPLGLLSFVEQLRLSPDLEVVLALAIHVGSTVILSTLILTVMRRQERTALVGHDLKPSGHGKRSAGEIDSDSVQK